MLDQKINQSNKKELREKIQDKNKHFEIYNTKSLFIINEIDDGIINDLIDNNEIHRIQENGSSMYLIYKNDEKGNENA